MNQSVEAGNAWDDCSRDCEGAKTGWFVGGFPEMRGLGLRECRDVEIKWYEHPEGQESGEKPVSRGLTVSVLVTGRFAVSFQDDESSWVEYRLEKPGDYVVWGPGIYHRWKAIERSVVLSVRPTPGK
jgi:hypothetical protein